MKETNYWKQFWETGRVEDYLRYRAGIRRTEQSEGSARETAGASFPDSLRKRESARGEDTHQQEGTHHAGLHESDGDRAQGGFRWGI